LVVKPTKLSLCLAQPEIQQADLLLFKSHGLISRGIRTIGRSEYSHAAKVDIWDGVLYCVELREFKGGRIVTLESQVLRYPGQIDVFRTNPHNLAPFNRAASAAYMRQYAGQDYGYAAIVATSLQYLPVIRLLYDHDYSIEEGKSPDKPPFCSGGCAAADQFGGGIDPVPHLAGKFTTPGDLGRSMFYEKMFTLEGV